MHAHGGVCVCMCIHDYMLFHFLSFDLFACYLNVCFKMEFT